MNREGIDGDRQVFGVHLREALAARVVPSFTASLERVQASRSANVLEELLEHGVVHDFRSVPVQLDDLLALGVVRVEGAELARRVAEQDEEVLALGARDLLEHPLLRLAVHHPREDAILDRVQDDRSVRTGRRLFVQLRT